LSCHSWLTNLDATRWLQHVGAILYGTLVVVGAVEDACPVLIHCSDGWDRTAQISSLAQLLLDPFYRTIQVQKKKEALTLGENCMSWPLTYFNSDKSGSESK
jgi:hypothetical protein